MIRTLLRALGLLMSAASLMALVTARGPSEQPSALERIPVLMDALEARLAGREVARASAMSAAKGSPGAPPSGRAAPSETAQDAVTVPGEGGLAPPGEGKPIRVPAGLPRGTGGVKVNRGLP